MVPSEDTVDPGTRVGGQHKVGAGGEVAELLGFKSRLILDGEFQEAFAVTAPEDTGHHRASRRLGGIMLVTPDLEISHELPVARQFMERRGNRFQLGPLVVP